MLLFADEIELVPFDQPLQLPEGMSPIGRAPSDEASAPHPARVGESASAQNSLASVVCEQLTPFYSHRTPLFNPAA